MILRIAGDRQLAERVPAGPLRIEAAVRYPRNLSAADAKNSKMITVPAENQENGRNRIRKQAKRVIKRVVKLQERKRKNPASSAS